nr:hypothetical protein KPHV_13870 [Kitasatospora purpeofusca]
MMRAMCRVILAVRTTSSGKSRNRAGAVVLVRAVSSHLNLGKANLPQGSFAPSVRVDSVE